jgi:hypothetical protein
MPTTWGDPKSVVALGAATASIGAVGLSAVADTVPAVDRDAAGEAGVEGTSDGAATEVAPVAAAAVVAATATTAAARVTVSQAASSIRATRELPPEEPDDVPIGGSSTAVPEKPKALAAAPRGRRSWRIVAVAAVIALIVVGALGLVAPGGGSNGGVDTTSGAIAFKSTTSEGAAITRDWRISGEKGTAFAGSTTLKNPTDKAITLTHLEVIPKSLAASADEIKFQPEPTKVIEVDPIVSFDLTLKPGEAQRITYRIAVEKGPANDDRLTAWAADRAVAVSDYQTRTNTPSVETLVEDPVVEVTTPPNVGNGRTGGGGGTVVVIPTDPPVQVTDPPAPVDLGPCPGQVQVPNLIGVGRDGAYAALDALGLNAPRHYPTQFGRTFTGVIDYSYPIVSLVPSSGTCVARGSTVKAISWTPDDCIKMLWVCYDLSGNPL